MLPLPSRRSLARLLVALAAALPTAAPAADEDAVFAALRAGGHAILVRHAIAPGGGDPPGFVLEDCATQRNLSDEGRAQAARLGQRLRQHGVAVDRVLSSRWCRALETARLMALAPVEPALALDS
ncbi:MAG: histidine phosphatase family protein, partial [Dongiaceae bacterium]